MFKIKIAYILIVIGSVPVGSAQGFDGKEGVIGSPSHIRETHPSKFRTWFHSFFEDLVRTGNKSVVQEFLNLMNAAVNDDESDEQAYVYYWLMILPTKLLHRQWGHRRLMLING